MIVWMATTNDKYELPLAVADTQEELAKMVEKSPLTIRNLICKANKGIVKNSIYKKVEIDESEV